ncbi:uncharacterized protein C19orf44 homolog isoform X2 [Anolis carolinensis]|uniref:uncharacterized protein C19orf44 homolog isoform X2 n=1 Tax=Anolis carolinensis TaxID=28377 RepID=UPI002F2B5D68
MRRDRGRAEEGPKRTQKKDPPWKTASTWRTGSSEEEEAGGASRQPRRFLKPKPDAGPTGGQLTPGPLPAPQRPSPALRKAAQVQRRISRRREEGAGHRAALLDASELSSAASDPHSVPGGSQDPTDRKGGLPGPAKRPSSRSAPKKDPRTPAAPLRPPSRAADHSPLATPGLPGISLEEEPRAIRSLDELFSEADQDQASLASSDSDFRVNVLSLDDLAPAGSIKEEEESREERARPVAEDPEKNPNAASLVPSAAAVRSVFSAPKDAVERGPPSREEEEAAGETEVSERLGSPSEAPPSSPGGTEYWDDFEPSSSSSPSSSSRASQSSSEEGAASEESRSKAPPPRSSRTGSSSLWQFSGTPKQRTTTTTDAAVQTNSPPPLSQWTQADIPIIGLALGGGSRMGATPVGSPALSLDAIEGLAAHSPAAFALNEMLKENLLFIRTFSEASRRLHASLVASLEEERFHYHSLEEAKRYIQSHKARRPTAEEALTQGAEQEEAAEAL